MYYIISLKHTAKEDNQITFWRENNAGYSMFKEGAGVYESYEVGYHDSEANIPVLVSEVEKLFKSDGKNTYLPNNKLVLGKLGLEYQKRRLTRIAS